MLEAEELAWVVLRAANRTQARGSTVRLVVPRAPEVAERGYVAALDIGLTRGAYTITPAGLRWLKRSPVAP